MEAMGVIALGVSAVVAVYYGAKAWNRRAEKESEREEEKGKFH